MNKEQSKMERSRSAKYLASGVTVVAAAARLLPHPPNFTPVGGMCLFAGARVQGWLAWVLPILLMAATDAFLGYSRSTPFIYLSFLINVWIGRRLVRNSDNFARIGGAAFLCSLQFFLITNFATFALGTMYPHTWAGLATCYTAAIPFWGRTLLGDLLWSGAIFGIHLALRRKLYLPERTFDPV